MVREQKKEYIYTILLSYINSVCCFFIFWVDLAGYFCMVGMFVWYDMRYCLILVVLSIVLVC